MADRSLPFFVEQADQPLLLLDQRINFLGCTIEEIGNAQLVFKRFRQFRIEIRNALLR